MTRLDYIRARLIWLAHVRACLRSGAPASSYEWFTFYRKGSLWYSGLHWPGA